MCTYPLFIEEQWVCFLQVQDWNVLKNKRMPPCSKCLLHPGLDELVVSLVRLLLALCQKKFLVLLNASSILLKRKHNLVNSLTGGSCFSALWILMCALKLRA